MDGKTLYFYSTYRRLMKYLIILVFTFRWSLSFAQQIEQFIIYDVAIEDTNKVLPLPYSDYQFYYGNYENIPLEERKIILNGLFDNIQNSKYQIVYREDLSGFLMKFPEYAVDSIQFQRPFPPYEFVDSVCVRSFTTNNIFKMRFYEKWINGKDGFSKVILAFSFIVREVYWGSTVKLREPLLFITNPKYLEYLKLKLVKE